MIYVFIGENSFETTRAMQALVNGFEGQAERIDGATLAVRDLPDLLTATTLFADKRLVIIKGISENSTVWNVLPDWLSRVSDDIDLVFIDAKPDKRTTVFKTLKDAGEFREFAVWGDRDEFKAIDWLVTEAQAQNVTLNKKLASQIVGRVGVDQWQLLSALEKLSVAEEITSETIDYLIDARPSENVFNLFESALRGEGAKLHKAIATLELTEEPYKLFALLSSQVFQLAAIYSATPGDNTAKDFAIHPFVVSKLSSYAKKLARKDIHRIVNAFASADADMKSSRGEPWTVIERTLLTVAA